MGRFRGHHIPDEFQVDWKDEKGMPEYWYWYMLGHEDGFEEATYFNIGKANEALKLDNERMHGELATLSKTKSDMREEFDFINKICKQYDQED